MRLVGTILTPEGAAYEVLGERDLTPGDLGHLFDGFAGGKAAFFDAGFRLRPVGSSIFAPVVTDEERAEADKRLTTRNSWRSAWGGLAGGGPVGDVVAADIRKHYTPEMADAILAADPAPDAVVG